MRVEFLILKCLNCNLIFDLIVIISNILEKSQECERWKNTLAQEQATKVQLEQQLVDLEGQIQHMVEESEQLKQEKAALEAEASAKEEQLSHVNSQLETDLKNKNEEMHMLKESFSVLLAEKEGDFVCLWLNLI